MSEYFKSLLYRATKSCETSGALLRISRMSGLITLTSLFSACPFPAKISDSLRACKRPSNPSTSFKSCLTSASYFTRRFSISFSRPAFSRCACKATAARRSGDPGEVVGVVAVVGAVGFGGVGDIL